MEALAAALAALAALCAALAIVLVRTRRGAATQAVRLKTAAAELERLQQAFARFAPAQIVDQIAAHGVSPVSEKKEITVLFADLRGFTALSEVLDPGVLVEILNGYLSLMSRVLTAHRGHVAQFTGDGIMAWFGALEPNPWQSDDAVKAALAMRAALVDYNVRLRAKGHPELAIGVGIHRGPVVAGVIGTSELSMYALVGITVNTAARVQSLTRDHRVEILLTEQVRAAIDPGIPLRAMPPTQVKGISAPLVTYAVDAG